MLSSISKTYKFTRKNHEAISVWFMAFASLIYAFGIAGEYLVEKFSQNLHENFTANIKLDFENKFFECFYDYFLVQFYWMEK